MPVIVEARCETERFYRHSPRGKLMRIAQVDQGMAESRDEIVDERLLALQQEFVEELMPVVAIFDELIFEEVDKCSLVSANVD